jgi:hypothetical protein
VIVWPEVTVAVELFPFRYLDPMTGRWVKARYKATQDEIAARHAEWEITGPAEVRSPIGRSFHPYPVVAHAELIRLLEPVPQVNPHLARPPSLDRTECWLVSLLLRRYATYCARSGRYAQMQGAARLHDEVVATMQALG